MYLVGEFLQQARAQPPPDRAQAPGAARHSLHDGRQAQDLPVHVLQAGHIPDAAVQRCSALGTVRSAHRDDRAVVREPLPVAVVQVRGRGRG